MGKCNRCWEQLSVIAGAVHTCQGVSASGSNELLPFKVVDTKRLLATDRAEYLKKQQQNKDNKAIKYNT